MRQTGIVYDPVFMEHDTGYGHPERPERLSRIYAELKKEKLLSELKTIPLREATEEEILTIHSQPHLSRIASTAGRAHCYLDGDTPTSENSFRAALLAAGSLLNAVDAVLSGELDNAFALIRPPGHHAERDQAMGFCLFNNVAIAARHAILKHKLSRVLVIDWDVHHGNATQHSFYTDPQVLYFSTHRYPFYPGTGYFDEIGSGAGQGYTVNVPLPGGCGDEIFDAAFAQVLTPVAKGFRPELILVSAGFDSHCRDPLGGMEVTEEGFARMMGRTLRLAEEFCSGKVVLTLEGGYDLDGLARSVARVIEVLLNKKPAPKDSLSPEAGFFRLLDKERECLGRFWPGIGGEA